MATFNGTVNQIENNTLKVNEIKKENAEGTYPTTEAVKKFVEPIMNDYIIEQGTTDIWTWEKWNSGKAVCWCTVGMFGATPQGENDCYKDITFPFEFVDIPNVFVSNWSTSGIDNYGTLYGSARLVTKSSCQITMRYPKGLADVYNAVHIIGRWK